MKVELSNFALKEIISSLAKEMINHPNRGMVGLM